MAAEVFRRDDALARGMSEARLRNRRLVVPTRGVRVATGLDERGDVIPATLRERCRAAALVLSPTAAFSHTTALRLHHIEVPWLLDEDDALHVVTPTQEARAQRRGIVAHATSRPVAVTRVAGIRVVTPAHAWVQVASLLGTVDDVVVLGDRLLDRRSPRATLESLEETLTVMARSPGVAVCRQAIPLIRFGTDSSMETRARLELVRSGLPCPLVNEPVHDDAGRFVSLPDMKYERERVAIEYDGDVHRTDRATWLRDRERMEQMHDLRWRVITATADDILRHRGRLAARARRALGDAAVRLAGLR